MNLADALAHHVRARPDRPAIVQGAQTILYRDLDGLVRRGAAHLAALGLREGDVVGIALRDSIAHLLALYRVARLGAVALPLDWRWTAAETGAVAAHFRARNVLVEPDAPALPGIACVPVDAAFEDAVARAPADGDFPSRADAPLLLSLSSGTTGRP